MIRAAARRRAALPALLAALLLPALAAAARAQAVPSDNVLRDFRTMEDFTLWVDGANYARRAQAYQPNTQAIDSLRAMPPATVRVFFGSWCPHCRENVPHLLKVEDALRGSKIRFEYFGLPQEHLADVPQAKQWK